MRSSASSRRRPGAEPHGLAIVRHAVGPVGGALTVRREGGSTTVYEIRLPVAAG